MKVKIEFSTNNAAFEYGFEEELGYILHQATQKLFEQRRRDPATVCDAPESADLLKDTNGNTVGTVQLVEEDSE